MPNGYWGRVLRVDLTNERTWIEAPPDELYRSLLGGRSFIAHYLLRETPPGIDAFDPANRLVFAAGPITGVPVSGAGRHSVGAKSPLAAPFGEAESGGIWGSILKHAGWDAIVVEGRADRPLYLSVNEDGAELRDAGHLWSRFTREVEDSLRAELGGGRLSIAQIGPAGENLVRFANITNDLNEFAGRTGLGAVMGSKHLKAIAVRGKRQVPVANPAGVRSLAKWVAQTLDENHRALHEYGTGAAMAGKQLEGHLVVRNFQNGQLPDYDQIDAVAVANTYRVSMDACYACAVRCKKRVKLESLGVDPRYGGPEYETLAALGTNQAMSDLAVICQANQLAGAYTMDTISLGATIAWATETFQRGLLTETDTGGLRLEWGNGQLLLKLVKMIGRREGFGDLLAEGALRAARKIGRGSERYVVQVKGLEAAMHDPRGVPEKRLGYAVSPTGADHTRAAELNTSTRNVVGMCEFLEYDEPQLLGLLNDVTGWSLDVEGMRDIARRGLTLARLFNLREGLTRADDRYPWRFHQPIAGGPLSRLTISEREVADMVTNYYREMGWDPRTGVPLPETLDRLGLAEYARDLPNLYPRAADEGESERRRAA